MSLDSFITNFAKNSDGSSPTIMSVLQDYADKWDKRQEQNNYDKRFAADPNVAALYYGTQNKNNLANDELSKSKLEQARQNKLAQIFGSLRVDPNDQLENALAQASLNDPKYASALIAYKKQKSDALLPDYKVENVDGNLVRYNARSNSPVETIFSSGGKAQSTLAKLAQDRNKGLIDDATYNAALAKETNIPLSKFEQQNLIDSKSDGDLLGQINTLREHNNSAYEMGNMEYPNLALRQFGLGGDEGKNFELMQQDVTAMAIPLAKKLGVNPTDSDFKNTMKAIVNPNSTRESRAAQIDALEKRIREKQSSSPLSNFGNKGTSNITNSINGRTATGSNGQKIILLNGKWQPL